MANTDVQITLEQAVAEVLTLLTGVDLTFNPAEDTFHVVARCLNRAMRSVLDGERRHCAGRRAGRGDQLPSAAANHR